MRRRQTYSTAGNGHRGDGCPRLNRGTRGGLPDPASVPARQARCSHSAKVLRLPREPPVSRVSSTNAPSRIEIKRSAVVAIRSSWVTITKVKLVACKSPSSESTSNAEALSGWLVRQLSQPATFTSTQQVAGTPTFAVGLAGSDLRLRAIPMPFVIRNERPLPSVTATGESAAGQVLGQVQLGRVE